FCQLRRAFLVRQRARGDGFGGSGRRGEFRPRIQTTIANGLQPQRLAGKNARLGLDVIFAVGVIVVSLRTLERKDVGAFAIDLDARSSDVHRTHAESGDGNDGNDRQHKRKDQPLVLAQNQQVVVKVRLTRRKIERSKSAGNGQHFYWKGAVFASDDFVFVVHFQ